MADKVCGLMLEISSIMSKASLSICKALIHTGLFFAVLALFAAEAAPAKMRIRPGAFSIFNYWILAICFSWGKSRPC